MKKETTNKTKLEYLLKESWNLFKKHHKEFLIIAFLFSFIPTTLLNIYQLYNPIDATQFINITTGSINWGAILNYIGLNIALTSIISLFTIFGGVAIITHILKNKKTKNITEILRDGTKYYLPVLGVLILVTLLLIPLYLLLIIPGLIFSIYFMFSQYFIIDEKEKITNAIKRSMDIVKNKWWKTVGKLIILSLLSFAIIFSIQIILILIKLILLITKINPTILLEIINTIIIGLAQLPISIYIILFTTLLYKGLKEEYNNTHKK